MASDVLRRLVDSKNNRSLWCNGCLQFSSSISYWHTDLIFLAFCNRMLQLRPRTPCLHVSYYGSDIFPHWLQVCRSRMGCMRFIWKISMIVVYCLISTGARSPPTNNISGRPTTPYQKFMSYKMHTSPRSKYYFYCIIPLQYCKQEMPWHVVLIGNIVLI